MTDLLPPLGALAFATRLRRLGEWLQRDVSKVYAELRFPFRARWFPVLWALRNRKSLAVTELADLLHLTHPAINQITNAMSRRGLLESRKDHRDQRRRLVRLTKKGHDLIVELTPVWEAVRLETEQVIRDSAPEMLDYLARIETSLADRSMYGRVCGRLKGRQPRRLSDAATITSQTNSSRKKRSIGRVKEENK